MNDLPTLAGGDFGTTAVEMHIESPEPLSLATERKPWHPEYGVAIETNRLTWRCETEVPCEVTTVLTTNS